MNMSFFRKSGGSGEIRGTQIAEYLGAKLNPEDGYQDDVCVYVKMQPPEDYPKNTYLDILDEPRRIPWLKKHPDVNVIASSETGYKFLNGVLDNKVIIIPQHHCNFDREMSENTHTVGVVGGRGAIMNDEIKQRIGYTHVYSRSNREEVVSAYKEFGIQIIWRNIDRPLKNPLKIINAAAFGIPTIAYPEIAYSEALGHYYPVVTIDEMIAKIDVLRHELLYKPLRFNLVEWAENYHIDSISELYRSLL